ncbi:hypothetical protein DICPUDRAFT_81185 [Dictyostelium purpureum]|uniref:Prefoldin subunit 6 n=1 Tax=Dictyostelium purpureum TaxID=5786 RepID=F0ZSR4_DICPU|nr:uncharacterized protein DICPUDRAFT_81185 [Dictyostelium purpureum]EGC33032.1 hypothetical protein DICPUDRAFT_81185 [Dictyostelium purpureum]|eukprot:XP_003290459.1 hypothetical protein DICPUDRAFT_81185 [Dictyostelium purpureum]
MAAIPAEIQKLQEELIKNRDSFQKLEQELQKLSANRSKLLTQLNENEMVKKEFDLLEVDAKIYKLNGPVLFKQTKDEAENTIAQRLNIINTNLKQVETNFKETEKKALDQRTKIFEIQNKIRAAVQPPQPKQQ